VTPSAFIVLALSAPASAPEVAAPIARTTLVETATVRAQPLPALTAATSVIDREEIERLEVHSVAELLRHVPGVVIVAGGARSGLEAPGIRGGDPNFTMVLVDGIPLNDATDSLRGGAVDLGSLSADLVERVEVVRGPLSSLYGSNALGGVINVITRRPAANARELSVRGGVGDDSFSSLSAVWTAGGERRELTLGLAAEREGERIGDDSFRQVALNARRLWRFEGGGSLGLTGRATRWRAEDYADLSGGPVFGSGETRESDHDELSLGLRWHSAGAARPHEVTASLHRHDLDRATPAIPAAGIPPIDESTRFTALRGGWNVPLLSRPRQRLIVGSEVVHERGRNESLLLFGPGFGIDGSYSIERTIGALFAEYAAERGRLLAQAGLRLDEPEGFDAELSPRLGASVRLDERGTRLRVAAARAFKLPGFFVLASPPLLGGNPELEPESSLALDVGLERHGARGHVAATLALTRYRDLIDFVMIDPMTFRAVNRADVRARSAELSLGWRAREDVAVTVDVTRQEVEDDDTGEPLRERPDWFGAATLDWQVSPRVGWLVELRSIGEIRDFPQQDRSQVGETTLLGSALRIPLDRRYRVWVRLDNLLGRDWETAIGFPGPGRSIRAGITWSGDQSEARARAPASRSPASTTWSTEGSTRFAAGPSGM
jgi:outer membrane cobalamin receptor